MEYLAGIIAWFLFIVPVCLFLRNNKDKEEAEAARAARNEAEEDLRGLLVKKILMDCFKDLQVQHASATGPWIPALLDGGHKFSLAFDSQGRVHVERQHRDVSPKVALTAVKMTIKDILCAPLSYDKDGREMPRRVLDLSTLYEAEQKLLEMGA